MSAIMCRPRYVIDKYASMAFPMDAADAAIV